MAMRVLSNTSNALVSSTGHARSSLAAPATTVPPTSPRRSRRAWAANVITAVAALGFGVTLGLGLTAVTRGALAAPGGPETAAGQIAGLTGSYLLLVMLLLISRLPWLEGVLGQDRLVRWHRRLGPWPIVLLGAHGVLITIGYAEQASIGPCTSLASCSPPTRTCSWRQWRSACSWWPAWPRSGPPAAAALRDLVGGAPLHLPGDRARLLPPTC